MNEILCMGCMETYDKKHERCPFCGYSEKTPDAGYELPVRTVLADKYIVGRVIGTGGFSITYLGYNAVLKRKIAIKEFFSEEHVTRHEGSTCVEAYSGEYEEEFQKGVNSFLAEAEKLAGFGSLPGVVQVFDSFLANHTAYIVMEYLEGETLKEKQRKEGYFSEKQALSIMLPVLNSLTEIHKEGLLHRDISPDNIFITTENEVKLIDFGASRYASAEHTKSLSVLVKPGYAPPEQYMSRGNQGTWTDVYSCGAVLYKMLTGVDPEDAMERLANDTLIRPSKLRKKISSNCEAAILNAMNLHIENRTSTVEALEAELCAKSKKITHKKETKKKTDTGKIKKTVWVFAAFVCLGIAGSVLFITNFMSFRPRVRTIEDAGNLESNQVYMPDVVNLPLEEAKSQLKEAGLIPKVTERRASNYVPENMVLSQSVNRGEIIEEQTVVHLTVSIGGEETVRMPDLTGLTLNDAIEMCDDLGIYLEQTRVESMIAPDCVVSQSVEEKSLIKQGDIVEITVSSGKENDNQNDAMTTVPLLTGQKFDTIINGQTLQGIYLYKNDAVFCEDIPKGEIISQSVDAYEEVRTGTSIGVTVSLGPETAFVPDLYGKPLGEAETILEDLGLKMRVVYLEHKDGDEIYTFNQILDQEEEPDTELELSSEVTVYAVQGIQFYMDIVPGESENLRVGDTFNVTVTVKVEDRGNRPYGNFHCILPYDPEYLELVETEGDCTLWGVGGDNTYIQSWDFDWGAVLYGEWSGVEESFQTTLTFRAKKQGNVSIRDFLLVTIEYYSTNIDCGRVGFESDGEYRVDIR